ncbi:MAG TPA: nitrite/sulfite reductase, partial [Nocardioides sp.]|nr:nitrite/sulfite reductase [Nocardioides sp.]
RDYGYRRLRSRARLKFLVADWGRDKFREVLENEYLGKKLVSNPSPEYATHNGDHIGVHEQKDGNFYIGLTPVVGRINGAALTSLGDLVEKYGVAGARLTAYQKVVLIGVAPDQVDALVDELDAIGFSAKPSHWRRSTMACTGIEFCKLAIVDTKQRAIDLVAELEKRFPDLDTPISVNVNGCPNACARTQIADIGLKGQLVLDDDGNQVEGFQVHLGGGIGLHTTIGKKLRAHKVTSKGLDDYVTTVVQNYLADREGPQESFAQWVVRTDEDLLRGDKSLATV